MCGIAGFIGITQPGLIQRMCDTMRHRGPDSDGIVEIAGGPSLGMRRLAIIDLATGDQPSSADDGRVQLVFNGEIYNYRELRTELRELGHHFQTQSDTEVVLQAYLAWRSAAWARLQGMFTIAVADQRGDAPFLRLVRDRVGIKPLYYISRGDAFIFASEIKALLAWSGFHREIDDTAISNYLALRYVPGPGGLFKEVRKAPPGHELVVRHDGVNTVRWWSPPAPRPVAMTSRELVDDLGEAMRASVRRHMISDVPVGAFLSGGVDSTVIAALMAEATSQPIRTFSIGFLDHPDDDTQGASQTAAAIGAQHTPIVCRPEDFAALPDLAWSLDEPIGDPIVVPMNVLAREARKSVTVVLSGEGADELFGGYLFHRKLEQLARLQSLLPRMTWTLAAALVRRLPPALLDRFFDYPGALGADGRQKIAGLLHATADSELAGLYRASISLFEPSDIDALSRSRLPAPSADRASGLDGSILERLLSLQYAHWLPDDILMKADKMTMANSLECRVPFMDELVIDAAARGGDGAKLRDGMNKWALRQFCARLLPGQAARAPKRAFYAPIRPYLESGPLAEICNWALDPERLKKRGLFDVAAVNKLRAAPASEGFLPEKRLFSILMLELWFERFAPDATWA